MEKGLSALGAGRLSGPSPLAQPASNLEAGVNACGRTTMELLQKAKDIRSRLNHSGSQGVEGPGLIKGEPSLAQKPWHIHDSLIELQRELNEISEIIFGNS
jgi:hypothetical protein